MSSGLDIPEYTFENRLPNDKSGRMRRLLDRAAKYSPTAAEVIEDARNKGCRYDFMSGIDGYIGFFDVRSNAVCLNVMLSNDALITTLVHESRHAVQPTCLMSADRNIRTNLQINRSKEADAMAFECAAAFEMQDKYPKAWYLFKKDHPHIAVSYAREMKKNADRLFALGEAFKAWHDDAEYVSEYDGDVIKYLSSRVWRTGRKFLTENMPPREVAGLFCTHKGKGYLDDPDFLSSPRALTVGEDILMRCRLIASKKEALYGNFDTSVDELNVRRMENSPFGKVSPNHFVARTRSTGR